MSTSLQITEPLIESKIYLVRGMKVMLDVDLAEMYGVETKRLKEQVRRNIARFPDDFMFELTKEQAEKLLSSQIKTPSRSQIATLKRGENIKFLPFAFTEHGVLMLSSVLRSEQAVQVNIQIMRVYSKMKELLIMHKDILVKLEKLEKKSDKHDEQIQLIFSYIKKLIEQPKTKTERIGFKKEW
ncbi:MAG: ORF6N domain-containing protein [Chitinophagaceae bacterium]|nr:ORF6N domain-containing protein [Chitinophagaceae bacterium]